MTEGDYNYDLNSSYEELLGPPVELRVKEIRINHLNKKIIQEKIKQKKEKKNLLCFV